MGREPRLSLSIPSDEESIQRAGSLGIRYVELAFVPPLKGRIEHLSKVLRSADVEAASLHGPFGLTFDVGNFDDKGRRDALARHKEHVRYCDQLGAGCYVIHPGFDNYWKNGGGTWDDATKTATFPRDERTIGRLWETNASSLAELADSAKDLGVRIALETGPPSIMTPAETIDVVKLTDKTNVGVCVDTGHINVGMMLKPADVILQAGRLLWALHLHDNKGDGDFHLPPGRGNIDWSAVARALRAVSYQGTANLELSPTDWKTEDAWVAVREGISCLRKAFGKVC